MRKDIFTLISENYNIQDEIKKINKLLNKKDFEKEETEWGTDFTFIKTYSLKEIIDDFLFRKWGKKATCLTVDEFLEKANAKLDNNNDEETITNNLEAMENLLFLYKLNYETLEDNDIQEKEGFTDTFQNLLEIAEREMGLTKREFQDYVKLYPQNAPVEQIVNMQEKEEVQWELLSYIRGVQTLEEKRKSLSYIATNLNIESNKNEKNVFINHFMEEATNILNNANIRHDNENEKSKNHAIQQLTEQEQIELCYMVFNDMLIITLLRNQKNYKETYRKFKEKQKSTC